ncbi:hypothetical protein AAVH_25783 [Aphelenchoides avenae]|nr:hypothetical protein AAVH_25783 [Aphelenchus avenae]
MTVVDVRTVPHARLVSVSQQDMIPMIVATPVTLFPYFVVAFCAIFTSRFIARKWHKSDRRRQLQRQIAIALLVQASTPLLLCVLPQMLIFVYIANSGSNCECIKLSSSVFAWMPAVNATSTLLIVKPFRTRLAAICRIKMQKSVVAVPTFAPLRHTNA